MKLGPFQIDHPFVLAPMAGITNSPFRRLMRRYRSSLVVSELISANGIFWGNTRTRELLRFSPEERPVGLQIFGETDENLVQACQLIESLGADFVDLNLGCPVPKVVKKGAGSAMCRNPIALGKTLQAMVKSVQIPVTIKIRTGWDAENINALEIVRVASDAGVAWVAIHGRTRAQGYSGLADWDLIGDVKAKSPLPIIGNGDIQTAEQAVNRVRETGVDAVLIGRAALRNPFIFLQSERLWKGEPSFTPTAEEYFILLQNQRELLREGENASVALLQSKKFLAWYSAGFPGSAQFRRSLFEIKDFEVIWEAGFQFFEKNISDRSMEFMQEAFLMGGHG